MSKRSKKSNHCTNRRMDFSCFSSSIHCKEKWPHIVGLYLWQYYRLMLGHCVPPIVHQISLDSMPSPYLWIGRRQCCLAITCDSRTADRHLDLIRKLPTGIDAIVRPCCSQATRLIWKHKVEKSQANAMQYNTDRLDQKTTDRDWRYCSAECQPDQCCSV